MNKKQAHWSQTIARISTLAFRSGFVVKSVNISVAHGTDEYSDYNGKITENNWALRFTYGDWNYTEYEWLGT